MQILLLGSYLSQCFSVGQIQNPQTGKKTCANVFSISDIEPLVSNYITFLGHRKEEMRKKSMICHHQYIFQREIEANFLLVRDSIEIKTK